MGCPRCGEYDGEDSQTLCEICIKEVLAGKEYHETWLKERLEGNNE